MNLTEEQIDYIATNLQFYGVSSDELKEDLLDHICTHIESGNHTDFDVAYNEAILKFGGYAAMVRLERDTYLMVTLKKKLRRQKLVYLIGFISMFTFFTGMLFKIMHWPRASILLLIGFIVLLFGYLPLYFYQRYKIFYRKQITE